MNYPNGRDAALQVALDLCRYGALSIGRRNYFDYQERSGPGITVFLRFTPRLIFDYHHVWARHLIGALKPQINAL